jgi:hypothetical protein
MTVLAALLGVSAGLVGIFDTVPYLRDVMRGSTRPHRGTWLIWSALAVVVCLSQWADGASWSLIMLLTQAVLTTGVFAVAIVRGQGGTTIVELVLIAVAGAGVAGWLLSGEPLVATVCVVAADLIAAAMMVPKTPRGPRRSSSSSPADRQQHRDARADAWCAGGSYCVVQTRQGSWLPRTSARIPRPVSSAGRPIRLCSKWPGTACESRGLAFQVVGVMTW